MSRTHCPCGNDLSEKQVAERRRYCSRGCARRLAPRPYGEQRRRALAAASPQAADRICLSCDLPFLSEGPWNRMCPRCQPRRASVREPLRVHFARHHKAIVAEPLRAQFAQF